jgi:hypothetical protein
MFHTPRQYRHTIALGATLPNIHSQSDNNTSQPHLHLGDVLLLLLLQ